LVIKATHEQTKVHNRNLILQVIYNEGPISRADVARTTSLTRTTVSSAVSELIDEGLVTEHSIGRSIGGKPPILMQVVDDCRYLIGVDLADSEFRGAIVNLRGQIKHRITVPIHDRDGDAALVLVHQLIDELIAASDQPILGIGIGTPGLMDAHRGVVRNAVNLNWKDLPLGDLLRVRYKVPVYIANDSQVAALAELAFGNNKNATNLIVIKGGRGIGAGIVIDRQLYYGDDFSAGEIGHVVIQPEGRECRCGNHGCLETLASTRALIQQAQQEFQNNPSSPLHQIVSSTSQIDTDTLVRGLEMGNSTIKRLVEEAGSHLGFAVTFLVSSLNIHHIVIAGSIARFGEAITQPIRQRVELGALHGLAAETRLEISDLDQDIVILGAAALILSHELGLS
jgi:glucokinase-like ROK family protein